MLTTEILYEWLIHHKTLVVIGANVTQAQDEVGRMFRMNPKRLQRVIWLTNEEQLYGHRGNIVLLFVGRYQDNPVYRTAYGRDLIKELTK